MTILESYLSRAVLFRLLMVNLVFAGVFGAYSLAIYLAEAADGILRPEFVLAMVGLKVLIALEMILPISLYVAVLLAASKLMQTRESTAMLACGFGPRQSAWGLTPLFLMVAILVGVLSCFLRPAAYSQLYGLKNQAESAFDFSGVRAGRFYVASEGKRVVYIGGVDSDGSMKDVFIWNRSSKGESVMQGTELVRSGESGTEALLDIKGMRLFESKEDGWGLRAQAGSLQTSVDFGGLLDSVGYKRKAAATIDLSRSSRPEDLAEYQWRLSRPLSTLLLGFLGLTVAGWACKPNRKWWVWVVAIAACTIYLLFGLMARSWVKNGSAQAWPGVWWVEGLLIIVLLLPALFSGHGQSKGSRRPTRRVS